MKVDKLVTKDRYLERCLEKLKTVPNYYSNKKKDSQNVFFGFDCIK
jgi:hypothetical protein